MSVKHGTNKYIPVHTGMYHHNPWFHSNQAAAALRRRFVSAAFLCSSLTKALFLAIVCSIFRPPKRGFPRPNCHSHRFTSYTLLPGPPSTTAESAQPNGKPESLRFLNMWGMIWVEFYARKQWIRGTLPTIFLVLGWDARLSSSSESGGTSGSPCSCSESDPWEGWTISRWTA